jgi:hypothetical protein
MDIQTTTNYFISLDACAIIAKLSTDITQQMVTFCGGIPIPNNPIFIGHAIFCSQFFRRH